MGLYIYLTVNFNNLTEAQWEQTYCESVQLLEKFPAPLMRLQLEEVRGQKRYTFTAQVRDAIDTPDENWDIAGDMATLQHAEGFRLYRHLKKYNGSYGATSSNDVLFAEENSINYLNGEGIRVFDNKTQGYPYHLALLAVGMLVESRFPENAYVCGNFKRADAELLLPWINGILEKPVDMPVCVDGQRLLARLDKLYDKKILVCNRFTVLFRGSNDEELQELLLYGNKTLVSEKCLQDLSHYQSLNQTGAIRILKSMLAVMQDLSLLIDLVQQIAARKMKESVNAEGFQLAALFKVLTDDYITVDKRGWRPRSLSIEVGDKLPSTQDIFAHLISEFQTRPDPVGLHIPASQLLELFCRYEPENRESFERMINKSEAKFREEFEEFPAPLTATKDDHSVGQESICNEYDDPSSLPNERALVEKFIAQKKPLQKLEENARAIGAALQLFVEKLKGEDKLPERDGREDCLESIYWATHETGIVLTETAWADIDAEEDMTILNRLLLLVLVKNNELNFWNYRKLLLEHKSLWPHLLEQQDNIHKVLR